MEYDKLLGTSFDCECGRRHHVGVRRIVYSEDAIAAVPGVLSDVVTGRRAVVVADERTWDIAGEAVRTQLEDAGWDVGRMIVGDTEHGGPVCDDKTFDRLKEQSPPVDIAVAVGCWVINDLTKWVAFERDIPYAVVATAATMNGFAAANIAATIDGVKMVLFARAPVAVLAVPSIIRDAPFELTAAGLGDVIAKPVSTADWVMNHMFLGEYFCEFCSRMINRLEPAYFDHPENVRDRDDAAIEALFNALVYSGVAMTVVGTSAPASGGEHMLSHTLDMMSIVDGEGHDFHGRQVGLGTLVASALYDRILKIDAPRIAELPGDIDERFWGPLAQSVRKQYVEKLPLMQTISEKASDPQTWRSFVEAAGKLVRRPEQIKNCLKSAGAAHTYGDIDCSRDRIRNAMLHMHEIRKRPTVVDLAWLLGVLPDAVDELIDRWLTS